VIELVVIEGLEDCLLDRDAGHVHQVITEFVDDRQGLIRGRPRSPLRNARRSHDPRRTTRPSSGAYSFAQTPKTRPSGSPHNRTKNPHL